MAGLAALGSYGTASSSDESEDENSAPKSSEATNTMHLTKPASNSAVMDFPVVAAPVVTLNAALDQRRHLDPIATEIKYNPK